MKIGSFCLFIFIFSFNPGAQGHVPVEGKIFGTLGPYFHKVAPSYVQDSASGPLSSDFALIGEGDFNNKGGVEVGIFYGTKTYQRAYGGNTHLSERVHKLSVPVGYRQWLTPKFSLALEFDASYTMGIPQTIFNNAPAGIEPTSARSLTEYGVDVSGQWEAYTVNRFALLIDTRYFYSLTAKPNEDANQYSFLVGIKYLIQEKYPSTH